MDDNESGLVRVEDEVPLSTGSRHLMKIGVILPASTASIEERRLRWSRSRPSSSDSATTYWWSVGAGPG